MCTALLPPGVSPFAVKCIMSCHFICTAQKISIGRLNKGEIEGHNSRVGKGEMLTEFLWGKVK